jgi:hypothetical protein
MKLFEIMDTAFDNFDNTVRTYLQKTFNDLGFNYTHNQIFGVIFDGIKGVMQNIMFYIEDAFTEQNIYTAQRKKSIYSLAKISGYEPSYGTSATGTIYCKLANNVSLNTSATKIYINNHSTIINRATNIIYTIILPTNYYTIDISKPLVTHEFKIIQGTFRTNTYIAKGLKLETINLTGTGNYDAQYITVSVDGEEWTQALNLYEMQENEKSFMVSSGYDNTLNIIFGNGTNGRIPEKGSSITITYINHAGMGGNINIYDKPDLLFFSEATDNLGQTVNLNEFCSLKINNMITGGTDPDTIDFVKQMIGYNSRSNVLASEDNYRLFLKRFSFVGDASLWCEENSSTVIVSVLSNYFIRSKNPDTYFITPVDKFTITENQKNMIIQTLNNSNKMLAGVNVRFQDPIIRKYAIICYVKSSSMYNQEDIVERLKNVIANYFIKLNIKTQFVPKSDIIKAVVETVDCIDAFDFNFVSELAEITYKQDYYDKQELTFVNRGFVLRTHRIIYEANVFPGLDEYGNISLDSPLEIPVLRGGFRYYPDKESETGKNNSITLDAIQVFFI